MLMPMLTIRGPEFDVDAFCGAHEMKPRVVWKRGEARRRGGLRPDSGFSILLASSELWAESWAQTRATILYWDAALKAARAEGADLELSFGFTVGVDPHFTRSIEFTADDLGLLVSLGVKLTVSAYPGTFHFH